MKPGDKECTNDGFLLNDMRTPENILTDSIFLMAFAQDLMIQDLLLRLKSKGDGLRQRSKFNLNEMIKALKRASHFADELREELFDADAEHKWKNIQTWQDEANEVARLVLLWEDREPHPDECDKIFKFIRQNTEGDGVVDDSVLSNYYLQKSCPIDLPEVGDRIRSDRYGEGTLEFNTIRDNWAVRLDSGEQVILSEKQFKLL